jgi:hypothetical protein
MEAPQQLAMEAGEEMMEAARERQNTCGDLLSWFEP